MKIHQSLPKHFQLRGLNTSEEVRLFVRRHPIVVTGKLSLLIFLALIPPVVYGIIVTQTTIFDDPQNGFRIGLILLSSLFYLFWASFLFTTWIDYYLDVWVVTTERILNIEQNGLFNRKISEQMLTQVQDVTTTTQGFLHTLLRYGDIHVQTAAEDENFVFRDISNPEIIADIIGNLQHQAVASHGSVAKEQQQPENPQPATVTFGKKR